MTLSVGGQPTNCPNDVHIKELIHDDGSISENGQTDLESAMFQNIELNALQSDYDLSDNYLSVYINDENYFAELLDDSIFEVDGWQNYCIVEDYTKVSTDPTKGTMLDGIQSARKALLPVECSAEHCSMNIQVNQACTGHTSLLKETWKQSEMSKEIQRNEDNSSDEEYYSCDEELMEDQKGSPNNGHKIPRCDSPLSALTASLNENADDHSSLANSDVSNVLSNKCVFKENQRMHPDVSYVVNLEETPLANLDGSYKNLRMPPVVSQENLVVQPDVSNMNQVMCPEYVSKENLVSEEGQKDDGCKAFQEESSNVSHVPDQTTPKLNQGKIAYSVSDTTYMDLLHEYSDMDILNAIGYFKPEPIWSILTTNIEYVTSNYVEEQLLYQVPKPVAQNAKTKYFDAANYNVPWNNNETIEKDQFDVASEEFYYESHLTEVLCENYDPVKEGQNAKQECFDAAHNNKPSKYEDRYEEVRVSTSIGNYDPERHMSTTYLWTEGEIDDIPSCIVGSFPITRSGEVTGELADGTKLNILIDSGASKSMLTQEFYESQPIMQEYPKYRLPHKRYITVANGQTMEVKECLKFIMEIHGHFFEFIAYLVPNMMNDFQFVMGQKSLYELEANIHFGNLEFTFVRRSKGLYATHGVNVNPGEAKHITFELWGCPNNLREAEVIILMISGRPDKLPQQLLGTIYKRKIHMTITNKTKKPINIDKGELCGMVDLRSCGYFHIGHAGLKTMMSNQCTFMSEEDTEQYISLVREDQRKIEQAVHNTKLVKREPQQNDPPQSMTNEHDIYPWLDKEDPRRHLTDEDIISKYVDLSESDLSKKEKALLL